MVTNLSKDKKQINNKENINQKKELNDKNNKPQNNIKQIINSNFINKEVDLTARIIHERNDKTFIFLKDDIYTLQCYIDPGNKDIKNKINNGDIVHVFGIINYSTTKILTLFIKNINVISPCSIIAPSIYYLNKSNHGYSNQFKTIDLTFLKNRFIKIKYFYFVIQCIREYMYKLHYTEAETPTLQKIAGGANAQTFETKYNFQKEVYQMRIASELYLKRLIITGFNKIFEITKNFRNESVTTNHNPEFTMLEVYTTDNYLEDVIKFSMDLLNHIFKQTKESEYIEFHNIAQNLSSLKPIQITFNEIIKKYLLIDIENKEVDSNLITQIENKTKIQNIFSTYDEYLEEIVTKHIIKNNYKENILILTHHPSSISPLAKINKEKNFSFRYEIYIYGLEITDGYEENTDYKLQHEVFKKQKEVNKRNYDSQYIEDMSLGMKTTAGLGMGINRLVKILTGSKNIRDCIAYIE